MKIVIKDLRKKKKKQELVSYSYNNTSKLWRHFKDKVKLGARRKAFEVSLQPGYKLISEKEMKLRKKAKKISQQLRTATT